MVLYFSFYPSLYTFLWKGKDKVTRASTINSYEEGGIKMVDIESLIKSLRLSWLRRIFGDNSGAWKKLPLIHLERFWRSNAF